MDRSLQEKDYPEGSITIPSPERRQWMLDPPYAVLIEEWKDRAEFRTRYEALKG